MAISKFNYNSFNVTPVASAALAFDADADGFSTATATSMTLIKTLTASSSATLSFVHGSSDVVLDSTYPIYVFKFINIHPATDNTDFMFNGSDDDSSHSYDITKTTATFQAYHNEAGNDQALGYDTSDDLAQSTAFQQLLKNLGSDNDQSASGELFLFNPSSTTFVKHFIATGNSYNHNDYVTNTFTAGYFNTTADITAIQFKQSSGNIDSGTIKLYGIKDS
jgi:hypothetical protein